jgi:hypothetical protein
MSFLLLVACSPDPTTAFQLAAAGDPAAPAACLALPNPSLSGDCIASYMAVAPNPEVCVQVTSGDACRAAAALQLTRRWARKLSEDPSLYQPLCEAWKKQTLPASESLPPDLQWLPSPSLEAVFKAVQEEHCSKR